MKNRLAIFASFFILHSAFCIANASPLKWDCKWPEAKSQPFTMYHGETATFEPAFYINGVLNTNIAITAVYIQTNGMGSAWWQLDNATFHPTNDVGAASYRFFVEGQGPSAEGQGLIYRANGTLRMLDSPGFVPNTVPIPPQVLDFAAIQVENAPWPAEIEAATNDVLSCALRGSAEYTDSAIDDAADTLRDEISDAADSAFNDAQQYADGTFLKRNANSITTPGVVTDWLASGATGGVRIRESSQNLNNYTAYAYAGIAVRRLGVTDNYLYDNSDYGIARMKDIPAIPTSWPWSSITSKPTTLAGYGITDATTKSYVDGAFQTFQIAAADDASNKASSALSSAKSYADNAAISTLEYIEGTNGASTNWTGRTQSPELWFGKTILFHVNNSGSGNKSLELTLPDGSTTGLIPIWGSFSSGARSRLQNHYPTGYVVCMTYCEYNGQRVWHCLPDYNADSNNFDRALVTYCKAAEAIPANFLTVGTTNGYYKLSAGRTFDLDRPILYCNAAQTAGKTNGNNWYAYYNGINLATTLVGWAGDATTRGKVVYLLGTVNDADNTFTIDAETPFSLECAAPCIPLGWYNENANSSFEFLPGKLIRDDIPTKQWVDDEITIRLTTTNAYISVSNGVQRIYEIDGTNRTLKWEWDMGVAQTVSNLVTQMLRKIEDTHTWSNYAASGVPNPFPDAVSLDKSTYFASSNVVWTANNNFAVLTSHLPATASGNASQFRIGTDEDDWFGLEVTASYLVDAHANSFRVTGSATKTATITTDYDASFVASPPVVYFTPSLAEPFSQITSGVTWAHNSSTQISTVTIQGLTASAGFFFLKKWEAGGAIFRSTLPILPEGYRVESDGSYVGTVQPDSIITITQGGHTYRLIAEEVQ